MNSSAPRLQPVFWRRTAFFVAGLALMGLLSACETSSVYENRYARYYDACDQQAGQCYARCESVANEEDRRACQASCTREVDLCFARIGDRIADENELRYSYSPFYGNYGYYQPGYGYYYRGLYPYPRSRYEWDRYYRDYPSWRDPRYGYPGYGYPPRGDGGGRGGDRPDRGNGGEPREETAGGPYGDWLRELQARNRNDKKSDDRRRPSPPLDARAPRPRVEPAPPRNDPPRSSSGKPRPTSPLRPQGRND